MGRVSNARQHLLAAMTDLMWRNSYRSATVDAICAHAKVKKGSFYYFFDSKADLAVAALADHWDNARPDVEKAFDKNFKPLLRFLRYYQLILEQQKQCVSRRNCTLGCPYVVLGSELCQHDEKILHQVRKILGQLRQFFLEAVQDILADNQQPLDTAEETAHCLFNMYEGALTQARVYDDLSMLQSLPLGTVRLLGLPDSILAELAETDQLISVHAAA